MRKLLLLIVCLGLMCSLTVSAYAEEDKSGDLTREFVQAFAETSEVQFDQNSKYSITKDGVTIINPIGDGAVEVSNIIGYEMAADKLKKINPISKIENEPKSSHNYNYRVSGSIYLTIVYNVSCTVTRSNSHYYLYHPTQMTAKCQRGAAAPATLTVDNFLVEFVMNGYVVNTSTAASCNSYNGLVSSAIEDGGTSIRISKLHPTLGTTYTMASSLSASRSIAMTNAVTHGAAVNFTFHLSTDPNATQHHDQVDITSDYPFTYTI